MVCTIYGCGPVHRLLRYVYRAGEGQGTSSPHQHAVIRLAASEHGDPAVDFFRLDHRGNPGSDNRQPEADKKSLQHVASHRSLMEKEKNSDGGVRANHAD